MAEPQPSKLAMRVRFPSPAPSASGLLALPRPIHRAFIARLSARGTADARDHRLRMRRAASIALIFDAVVLSGCGHDSIATRTTITTVGQRPRALICSRGQVLVSDDGGVHRRRTPFTPGPG